MQVMELAIMSSGRLVQMFLFPDAREQFKKSRIKRIQTKLSYNDYLAFVRKWHSYKFDKRSRKQCVLEADIELFAIREWERLYDNYYAMITWKAFRLFKRNNLHTLKDVFEWARFKALDKETLEVIEELELWLY